jgi:FkbM family methyltransferase
VRIASWCRACCASTPEAWSVLLGHVRRGCSFVDVGANVGLYAIAAAKRGAVVTAFEPDRKTTRKMRALAPLNRADVTIVEALVGAEVGASAFASRGSPVSSTKFMYADPQTRYVVAPVVTLDSVFGGPLDIVEIDVEGAEIDVLRGSRQTLEAGIGTMLLEVHPDALARSGHAVGELAKILSEHGYRYEELPSSDGPARWIVTRSTSG